MRTISLTVNLIRLQVIGLLGRLRGAATVRRSRNCKVGRRWPACVQHARAAFKDVILFFSPPPPKKSGRTPVIHCTYGPALWGKRRQISAMTDRSWRRCTGGRSVGLQEGSDALTCYFGLKMGVYAAAITSSLEKELKLSIDISMW